MAKPEAIKQASVRCGTRLQEMLKGAEVAGANQRHAMSGVQGPPSGERVAVMPTLSCGVATSLAYCSATRSKVSSPST